MTSEKKRFLWYMLSDITLLVIGQPVCINHLTRALLVTIETFSTIDDIADQ